MASTSLQETIEFWNQLIEYADVMQKQTTGAEDVTWTAPNGETGKSFLGYVREFFEVFGHLPRFKTVEALKKNDADFAAGIEGAIELKDGSYALVADDADDINGIYIKEGGAWVKSKYDLVDKINSLSKEISDANNAVYSVFEKSSKDTLDEYQDATGMVYRYTDSRGHLFVPLLPFNGSLQDNITQLNTRVNENSADQINLAVFKDDTDFVYALFNGNADFKTAGGLESVSGVLTLSGHSFTADDLLERLASSPGNSSKTNNNHMAIINKQLLTSQEIKTHLPIANLNEGQGDLTKRMPFAIKTNYGIVGFHHQQIKGYSGDGTGSQLWKFIIDIDDSYTPTLRSRELFLEPDEPRGIVKHPTLGRKSNNNILMIYEKRLETTDPYVRMQCESNDEGLSWSTPVPLQMKNSLPYTNCALGTTGVITRLRSGRLVVPMYTTNSDVFSMYSDDDGETWTNGKVNPEIKGTESSIVEDISGDYLVMDIRYAQNEKTRLRALSYDDGETWVKPPEGQYELLPSAKNQGSLLVDNVNGLVIQTHSNTPINRRDNYCLSLSFDGGHNFSLHYYPFDKSYYGGYSHVIKYDEGVYIVVVEYDLRAYRYVNGLESCGIYILNIQELIKNGSYN